MDYVTFCESLLAKLGSILPDEYVSAGVRCVPELMNCPFLILVHQDGHRVPLFPIYELYSQYRKYHWEEQFPDMEFMETIISLLSPENAKGQILHVFGNAQMFGSYMDQIPNRPWLDLRIYYRLYVNERYFFTINNILMAEWGFSEADLFTFAEQNYERLFVPVCFSMNRTLFGNGDSSFMKEDYRSSIDSSFPLEQHDLWTLSAQLKNVPGWTGFGAMVFLHPQALSYLAEKSQDDFYVLPSSTHELFCIPCGFCQDLNTALETVVSSNKNIPAVEFLSNSVYRYCRETGEFNIAITQDTEVSN